MASQSIVFRRHRENDLEPQPHDQPEPATLYVWEGAVQEECTLLIKAADAYVNWVRRG